MISDGPSRREVVRHRRRRRLKIRIGWTPAIDFLAEEPPPFTGPDTAHEPAAKGDTWMTVAKGRGKPAINEPAEKMPAQHASDYHQQPN